MVWTIFDVFIFLLSIWDCGISFLSISLLVLNLWQLLLITDWTRNLEIKKTDVWNLSSQWGLRQIYNTKYRASVSISSYWILKSCKIQLFTIFWVNLCKATRGIPQIGIKFWVCRKRKLGLGIPPWRLHLQQWITHNFYKFNFN